MSKNSKLSILQHNTARSNLVQQTLIEIGVKQSTDFILIQEPWVFEKDGIFTTIQHSSFQAILPSASQKRPRVAIYIRRNTPFQYINRVDLYNDSDTLLLDISGGGVTPFYLFNVYNERELTPPSYSSEGEYTLERLFQNPQNTRIPLGGEVLFSGDFNAHHPWWNSIVTTPIRAKTLVDWLQTHECELINEPDIGTFFRPHMQASSILDLAFATLKIHEKILDWQILGEKSGSDHEILAYSILTENSVIFENMLVSGPYNLEKANWEKFEIILRQKAKENPFFQNLTPESLKKAKKIDLLGLQKGIDSGDTSPLVHPTSPKSPSQNGLDLDFIALGEISTSSQIDELDSLQKSQKSPTKNRNLGHSRPSVVRHTSVLDRTHPENINPIGLGLDELTGVSPILPGGEILPPPQKRVNLLPKNPVFSQLNLPTRVRSSTLGGTSGLNTSQIGLGLGAPDTFSQFPPNSQSAGLSTFQNRRNLPPKNPIHTHLGLNSQDRVTTSGTTSTLNSSLIGLAPAEILENLAINLNQVISETVEKSIPKKRFSSRSKIWWSDDLTRYRKDMSRLKRIWSSLPNEPNWENYTTARNSYFSAIKLAKQNCWNSFLENAKGKEIFQAFNYTKNRVVEPLPPIKWGAEKTAFSFEEKCEAFTSSLFPKPPTTEPLGWENYRQGDWEWPKTTPREIEMAIFSSSPKKAPGPDQISFQIIQRAYKVIPDIFNLVYQTLLDVGYHPKIWKQAIGVTLKKPKKENYQAPKSYRIISLLNCLGKISEKVIATRLGYLAETTRLLHPTQIGGRAQKSAIDAALALTYEIQSAKKGKITSLLCVDIKGAFDHVAQNRLLKICQNLGLPTYLCQWIFSFLNGRSIQLAFDGRIQNLKPIEIGLPQGSPVSPILFLIYIRELFEGNLSENIDFLSYIDDIGITTSSGSARKNCRTLKEAFLNLLRLGEKSSIKFDMEKTDLIHFHKKRGELSHGILINQAEIRPKSEIRWLGVFFDRKLSFKTHVQKKVAAATRVFFEIQRLSNTQKGLTFQAVRQLYIACVTSIADYGVQIWWANQKGLLALYQKLQNLALRNILGAFRTTPTRAMEIEASLPPPEIRFQKLCANYALRISQTSRENHPIQKRLKNSLKNPQTQLEKVCKIQADLGGAKLETSLFRLNPPWFLPPDIQFFTPVGGDKIQVKENHEKKLGEIKKDINKYPGSNLVFYTDGTNFPKKGSALGLFGIVGPGQFLSKSWNLGQKTEVFDAELFAIYKALQLAYEKTALNTTNIWIFSDSFSAIQRIQKGLVLGPGQITTSKILTLARQISTRNISISIHWIPSHLGIFGNEKADFLAKKGIEMPICEENFISISHLKRGITQNTLEAWKQNWKSLKEAKKGKSYLGTLGEKPPNIRLKAYKFSLPRKYFSAFFQLKLGHGFFKSYLERLPEYSDPFCFRGCTSRQTPRHLLTKCSNFREEIRDLKRDLPTFSISLFFLFHTIKGIQHTLKYIQKTQISTRDWLANIA